MSCVRLPGFSWPATTKRRRRKSVGSLSGFSRRSPTAAGCSYVRARFIVIRFFFFFLPFEFLSVLIIPQLLRQSNK
jgi:hypothetical protein